VALTAAEIELVYEALDIPNTTSVLVVEGGFGTGTSGQHGAVLTTKTLIDARLAELDGSTPEKVAREGRLRALTVEWSSVSTAGVRLAPNVGNEGIDRDPARERRLVKRRISRALGVFRDSSDGGLPFG